VARVLLAVNVRNIWRVFISQRCVGSRILLAAGVLYDTHGACSAGCNVGSCGCAIDRCGCAVNISGCTHHGTSSFHCGYAVGNRGCGTRGCIISHRVCLLARRAPFCSNIRGGVWSYHDVCAYTIHVVHVCPLWLSWVSVLIRHTWHT
jgi:hypothetical protein